MQGNECPIHVADGVLGKQCHICAFFNGFDEQCFARSSKRGSSGATRLFISWIPSCGSSEATR